VFTDSLDSNFYAERTDFSSTLWLLQLKKSNNADIKILCTTNIYLRNRKDFLRICSYELVIKISINGFLTGLT
jgi:hypothetical protein